MFKGYRSNTNTFFFRRARAGGLRTLGRSTGGSSAGAAVAAGIVPIAQASDRSDSDSIPFSASWCGPVGLLPSRGRISGGADRPDQSFGLTRHFVLCRILRDMAAALDVFSGRLPGTHSSSSSRTVPMWRNFHSRLTLCGSVADVFADPRHSYTRALLDAVPMINPGRRGPTGAARRRDSDAGGSIRNQRCILRPVCLNPSHLRRPEARKIPALAPGSAIRSLKHTHRALFMSPTNNPYLERPAA